MLDTTTEAGGRAERRLREEQIIWMTTVRSESEYHRRDLRTYLGAGRSQDSLPRPNTSSKASRSPGDVTFFSLLRLAFSFLWCLACFLT